MFRTAISVVILSLLFCTLIAEEEVAATYVRSLTINGNKHFSKSQIRSLLTTKDKSLFARLLFWRKAPQFSENELKTDLQRIEREYQRAGFLSVAVNSNVEIAERKAYITLNIEEKIRVKVSDVDYRIDEKLVEDNSIHYEIINHLRKNAKLNAGKHYSDSELRADLRTINDYYDLKGYPYIKTDFKLTLADDEENVLITFDISPGKKAVIKEIYYEGLQRTDERLLQKLLEVRANEEYDRRKLEQTRNNLQSLGLFRLVSVGLKLDEGKEKIPVEIQIKEKENIALTFGTGYGIEDKIRVYGEVTKLRFLGGLRTGTLFLKHSALEPINADFKLTQPAFPTIKSSVVFNPFYRQEEEPAYSIDRTGASLTLYHKIVQKTGSFIAYSFEDNNLKSGTDDPDTPDEVLEKGSYRKSNISLGFLLDTSQPMFFPNKGNVVSNVLTFSGLGFNSDFKFLRMISDLRHYQRLNSHLVLAARIKGGFIEPLSEDELIPYEDRFYAGGAFSVRGWSRAGLGPKNSEGEPIGGKSYLEGSVELRYPVWKELSLVNFLDCGNVWQDRFSHDITDIRFAAGMGLRYNTPIGPVRLDVAAPVFDDEEKVQFFISIGQMF